MTIIPRLARAAIKIYNLVISEHGDHILLE